MARYGAAERTTWLMAGIVLVASVCFGFLTSGWPGAARTTSPVGQARSACSPGPAVIDGDGPPDLRTAGRDVVGAYLGILDPATPLVRKEALLQNAAAMHSALQGFVRGQLVARTRVVVTRIHFTSDNTAMVTYGLCSRVGSSADLAEGMAERQAGVWQVAAATFCRLAQLAHQGGVGPSCG